MNFKEAKKYILSRLETELSPSLYYHGIHHTLDVYEASIKLAELENLSQEEKIIINTATLYHDAGFMFQYANNEDLAVNLVKEVLPSFGYNKKAVTTIAKIILTTKLTAHPITLLEKIMSDADYDYLGRDDVKLIAASLHKELHDYGASFTDEEWNTFQLKFLNKHQYYTPSAIALRREKKWAYMRYLKSLKL
ncbi:MAG: HD domain-containing protein [Vicingus serpentipes]|nr:HD domain-containing protein [Vicingus serpentipes]